MAKVRLRLDRGMGWEEIARDIEEPLSTVYQRFQRLELREMKLAKKQEIAA
jgi:hypothetical protein